MLDGIGADTLVTDISTKTAKDFRVARQAYRKMSSEDRQRIKAAGHDDAVRTGEGLSPSTVNGELMTLQGLLTYCGEVEEIEGMRLIAWTKVKLDVPKKIIRRLSLDEQDRLLDGASSDLRRLIEFDLEAAFRRRNLVELRWSQIDFDTMTITIRQKGDRPFLIPVTTRMKELLDAIPRYPGIDAVFTFVAQRTTRNPKTGESYVKGQRYPMTYYGFGTAFTRLTEKVGVKCTIHDLRRTAGSETMVAIGLDGAADSLGHADSKVKKTSYATFVDDETRQARERAAVEREGKRIAARLARKPLKDEAA